jgi:Skp family chaperone for outer membrane proteins
MENDTPHFEDMLEKNGLEPQTEPDQNLDPAQEEIARLRQALEKSSRDFRSVQSEKDSLKSKYEKMYGFVQGSGIAEIDEETGKIKKIEHQKAEKTIADIEKEIKEEQKEIRKKWKAGDIEEDEYSELLDKVNDKKDYVYDLKLKQVEERINNKQEPQEPIQREKGESNKSAYDRIVNENPDVGNKDSALFQEMNKIFQSDPNYYSRGNPSSGGDANVYGELISKAKEALAGTQNAYTQPRGKGYKAPQKTKSYLKDSDINMLANAGLKDRSELKSINDNMGRWETDFSITMED